MIGNYELIQMITQKIANDFHISPSHQERFKTAIKNQLLGVDFKKELENQIANNQNELRIDCQFHIPAEYRTHVELLFNKNVAIGEDEQIGDKGSHLVIVGKNPEMIACGCDLSMVFSQSKLRMTYKFNYLSKTNANYLKEADYKFVHQFSFYHNNEKADVFLNLDIKKYLLGDQYFKALKLINDQDAYDEIMDHGLRDWLKEYQLLADFYQLPKDYQATKYINQLNSQNIDEFMQFIKRIHVGNEATQSILNWPTVRLSFKRLVKTNSNIWVNILCQSTYRQQYQIHDTTMHYMSTTIESEFNLASIFFDNLSVFDDLN